MPPKAREPRFDPVSIGKEVERGRVRADVTVAQIAGRLAKHLEMKWPRTYWYKKIAGTPEFTVAELGWLAEEFQAPKGWPIAPWDEGLAWDRHLEGNAP